MRTLSSSTRAAKSKRSVPPIVFAPVWPPMPIWWRRSCSVPSRKAIDRDPFAPCSVHLSGVGREVEFIRTGRGPWRSFLETLGVWNAEWIPPGVSPVQFLDDSGFLDARVLAVHGVQMTPADLSRLASRGTTLVTLPAGNGHTGAGAPPIEDFYESGAHVAIIARQPGQRAGSECVRRAATLRAGAVGVGVNAPGERDDRRGRGRSASTPITARSSRASLRGSSPWTFQPVRAMWKNTSCRGFTGTRSGGLMIDRQC
jgi:hypothetical protein